MDLSTLVELVYLASAVLFVVGLKRMQSPATARNGNALAALAMAMAIVAALVEQSAVAWGGVLIGVAVGALVGTVAARAVKMTAMPEMVGLLNAFGGAASALVSVAEYTRLHALGVTPTAGIGTTIALSLLIGTVTLSGSMVAVGKLAGRVSGNPITFPGQKTVSALLFLAILLAGAGVAGVIAAPGGIAPLPLLLVISGLSLLLGVLLVLPIGGADMPVVISLLNSYSGLAASAAGFVVGNMLLIIAGALVGAAGLFLTLLMCKAMNRSLAHVIFGAFGQSGATAIASGEGEKAVRSIDPEQAAMIMAYARSVIVVPGYGLAVAQAQHDLKKVMGMLAERGVTVRYAIHPVAGRMPGHMNVLLAEADVPYDQLFDLDEINNDFANTDVVLVVGANDVVNPEARNPASVIAGMPILDVDRARTVIVIKRSLSPGFAGIDNPLFYLDHTMMLFSDARKALGEIAREVREA